MNNLFQQLNAIQKGDDDYFLNLPSEERKKIVPFLLLKWLASSTNTTALKLLDNYANKFVFTLYDHPELIWKCLSASSLGGRSSQRLKWLSPKKQKEKFPKTIDLVKSYFRCDTEDAKWIIELKGVHFVEKIINLMGVQDDEAKAIMKELKK